MWFTICRETCRKLNKRFNWHTSCFKRPSKYAYCKILNNHFTEGQCKDAKYTVNILEKLEGSGRTERDAMDVSSKWQRKEREKFWMMTLRTVFPYGLNDRIGDEYKRGNTRTAVGKRFPPLGRKFSRIARGNNRQGSSVLEPDVFFDKLRHMFDAEIKNVPIFFKNFTV